MVSYPYLTRVLDPSGLGTIAYLESICRIIMMFSALGIPIYGVREIAKLRENAMERTKVFNELFALNVYLSIGLTGILLLFLKLSASSVNHLELNLWICIYIISNAFNFEWYFLGRERFSYITLRTIVIRMVTVLSFFLFIHDLNDFILYFKLNVLSNVLTSIVNIYQVNKMESLHFPIFKKRMKVHLKPLLYLLASILFIHIYTQFDQIILAKLTNASQLGWYSTAMKVAKLPVIFITSIGVVTIPNLAYNLELGNNEGFQQLIRKSFSFIIALGIPVGFFLLNFGEILMDYFLGSKFQPSGAHIKYLGFLGLFIGISNLFGVQILSSLGKEKTLTKIFCFGMLLSLSLNFTLIPRLQGLGAVISCLFTEMLIALTCIYAVYRLKKSFHLPWNQLLFGLALFSALTICSWLINVDFLMAKLGLFFVATIPFVVFHLQANFKWLNIFR